MSSSLTPATYNRKVNEMRRTIKANNFIQVSGQSKRYLCKWCGFEFEYRPPKVISHLESCQAYKGKETKDFYFLLGHYKPKTFSSIGNWTSNSMDLKYVGVAESEKGFELSPFDAALFKDDFVNMIVSGNVPFKLMSNFYLRRIIKRANPKLFKMIPSEQAVRTYLLDRRIREAEEYILKNLENSSESAISLAVDGWTSITKGHLMGAVLTRSGNNPVAYHTSYPIEFVEDNAVNNALLIENIILDLNSKFSTNINSFVSDNAAQLKKARSILAKRHPCVFFCHCMAHQINLVVGKLLKEYGYQLLEKSRKMVSTYKNVHKYGQYLSRSCLDVYGPGRSHVLKKMTRIRWNSAYFMMCSITRIRSAILSVSAKVRTEERNPPPELIVDENYMDSCVKLAQMLHPLTLASLRMQRNEATMADLVSCFLHLFDVIFELPESNSQRALLKDLSDRWSAFEQPLFLLAFILHPKYSQDYRKMHRSLSADFGIHHIPLTYCLRKYAKKHFGGLEENVLQSNLLTEFSKWIGAAGKKTVDCYLYEQKQVEDLNPWEFWEVAALDFPCLARAAKFLLSCKINSASCERLFSLYKYIKNEKRNRLTDEKMTNVAMLQRHLMGEVERETKKSGSGSTRKLLSFEEHPRKSAESTTIEDQDEDDDGQNVLPLKESPVEVTEEEVSSAWTEIFSAGEDYSEINKPVSASTLNKFTCDVEEKGTVRPEVFTGEEYRSQVGNINESSEVEILEPWRSFKIPLGSLRSIWKGDTSLDLQREVATDSSDSSEVGTKRKHGA